MYIFIYLTLSEQIQEHDPKVSTVSKFFTKTCFDRILTAVSVKETVTVANRPSGTSATIIPIAKTIFGTNLILKKIKSAKKNQKKMLNEDHNYEIAKRNGWRLTLSKNMSYRAKKSPSVIFIPMIKNKRPNITEISPIL
jgi:hypothetical protein